MTRSDYVSLFSALVSLATAYHVLLNRQQDHEIAHLHSLESKLYDAELDKPRFNCFYHTNFLSKEDCEEFRTVNVDTIAYLSLVVDFKKSVEEYQKRWCTTVSKLLFVDDCTLYSEFLVSYKSDPTGSFAKVEADK